MTDDQFDNALAEARSERRLSRANVARKCRGQATPPPPAPPDPPATPKTARARKFIHQLSIDLNSHLLATRELDWSEVDPTEPDLEHILRSLGEIRAWIRKARRQ